MSTAGISRPRIVAFLISLLILMVVFVATAEGAPLPSSDGNTPTGQSRALVMMIVYTAIALVFSFLCSVAEAVVLSVSPSFIANLKNSGRIKAATMLSKVKANIDRSLAAILTLNTIAHTVGAGGAGAEAAAYFGEKYVGIAMAVLTLLILFLSEIIPKTLGALYWRKLAPWTARFVQLLIWVLYPLIVVSEFLTKLLAQGKDPHAFSRDEFSAMVDLGAEAGELAPTESRILNNLLRFPDLCAKDIMTPRTVVYALPQDTSLADAVSKIEEAPFSRIPIFASNHDEVTGFVLKLDVLLAANTDSPKQKTLRDLKREIRGVHEQTHLSKVLEELLDNRAHILLVVDDYGGMDGIVTLEDVVETLIGIEIVDEVDTIDDMRRLARQKWEERMKRVGIDVSTPNAQDESLGDASKDSE